MPQTKVRRVWLPYIVLGGTLLLTVFSSDYAAISARARDQLQFENAVQRTQDEIKNRLETYTALLRSGSGLFAATGQVTRSQFQAYVNRLGLRQRYPGMQGIGYAQRITSADAESVVTNLRQQGLPNFSIRPASPPRDEFFPIVYLEPTDQRSQGAIGFDMFSQATRRAAMERARDSGNPAASGRVILIQEVEATQQAGFLLYLPVYQKGSIPETVAARRAMLIGFVYSPFRADDLLRGIFNGQTSSPVDFEVYDGTQLSPENLLHRRSQLNQSPKFTTTRTFEVAGRPWSLVFVSRPELELDSRSQQAPLIFGGGILISFVLFGVTRAQMQARLAAERAAADLRESEAALRQSESGLQRLVDVNTQTNQRLGFLYGMSSSLLIHEQPSRFISSLFNQLSKQLRLEVYVNYLFDSERQMLHLHSYSGMSDADALEIEWLALGQSVCGIVARDRTPIVIEQVQQSESDQAILVRSIGVTAYACYPLAARDQLIGTLAFGTRNRSNFDADELALMRVVCDQVATALERAQLLAELQRQTQELKQANRMKDEFLATLSHELRTPLNAMQGWTTMLRTRKLDADTTARALESVDRNTKSLAQLIEDVLEVSRIITGKLRLKLSQVSLAQVIVGAIETVRSSAEAKEIQIESQSDPTVSTIVGDVTRLQQVVWNLLSNAIKFTPKGGRVEISLVTEGSDAKITVSDTGQGISPEFLPYVFDRFRQADSSTTRSYGGLGLGLAIVHHIVEMHGGTVHAHSLGDGTGATFTVRLPLKRTEDKEVNTEVTKTRQPSSIKDVRVLVVDDETDARELVTTALESAFAIVTSVSTVREALEVMQHHPPDILISDIGMPDEDGYALIRQIRDRGEQIPAIALTAYAGIDNRELAIAAGFQQHLAKPFNPDELVVIVASLVNHPPYHRDVLPKRLPNDRLTTTD